MYKILSMEIIQPLNIIGIVVAYLLGSIPTSVWLGNFFYGIDVRETGSGNAGATNTIRVLGLKAGIPVLIFDALKGFLGVYLSYIFGRNLYDAYFDNYQILLGVSAMIGHIFPILAGFRGGKGIATLTGVLTAIFPRAVLTLTILYFIILYVTRYVSLASILTSVAFPLFIIFIFKDHNSTQLFIAFSIIMAIVIPWTHKKNIIRLFKGEEPKFTIKKQNKI